MKSARFLENSLFFPLLQGDSRTRDQLAHDCLHHHAVVSTGDFLKVYERPRIGGDLCDGSFSETASLQSAGRFCAFFSGPEIPFPGNGDRERQRLGSNAG